MHTYMFSFGSKQPLEVDIMITSIFHKGKLRLREASQLPKEHPEWGPKSRSLTPKSGVFPRVASPLGVCQHRLRTRRWLSRLSGKTKALPHRQVRVETRRLVCSPAAGVRGSVGISGLGTRPSERPQGPRGDLLTSFYSLVSTGFRVVSFKAFSKNGFAASCLSVTARGWGERTGALVVCLTENRRAVC